HPGTHSTSRTSSYGGPSGAPRPTRSTSAARHVTRPQASQSVAGSAAASTLAPTAAPRGPAAAGLSAPRHPGSTVASLLSTRTCVAPASSARRMTTLWPPAKPRFSGARSSTLPGATCSTSASARLPVPLSRTKSHAGGSRDVATLARQRSVSAFAPQWSTDTATRAAAATGLLLPLEPEMPRARILEPRPQRRRHAILVGDDRREGPPPHAAPPTLPHPAPPPSPPAL